MDVNSTNYLMGVQQALNVPGSALLDAFFGTVQTEDSEEIHFDVRNAAGKLAPFVSPYVEGKVVQEQGRTTRTFKPAYVKAKTPLDPSRPLKRATGEQFGGSLSAGQREQLQLANTLADQRQMIENRWEWMAAQAIRTGKVTVSGDGYPDVEVDFQRNAAHTVALSGAALWSDAGSAPLTNLQTGATSIAKLAGGNATDVLMDPDAWALFIAHADVKERINFRRTSDTADVRAGANTERGLIYKGEIDGFRIWVYQDWYVADGGTVTPFFPSRTVVLVAAAALEGVRAFGAIHDPEAGYVATPMYPKSWIEKDPARRVVMTQSAPLMVPTRPDATFAFTV